MSEFTKGEWEYSEYVPEGITLNGTEFLISAGNDDVALVLNEANARLIATAPEMYELLNSICSYIKDIETVFPPFPNTLSLWAERGQKLLKRIDGTTNTNNA